MSAHSSILGVRVDAVTMTETLDHVDAFVASRAPHQIVTVNVDFIRLARRNPTFRAVIQNAALSLPDGMPVLWAARFLGSPLLERVTGIDLVERTAALAASKGYSLYLLGAAPGVADDAAAVLCRRYPGLRIAGTYAPPFGALSDEQQADMVARVRAARPDILFVAFGAPRQDLWIAEQQDVLKVPVCAGIGGSFDLIAGRLKRAPSWTQRMGLEWLYRLIQEPGRLWKRYLFGDLPLFLHILSSRFTARPERSV